MTQPPTHADGHSNGSRVRPGTRPMLAGIEVREEDIETQKGLHAATVVIQGCALIILAMAIWQFFDWWVHQPPGGAGSGVVTGETVRLVVFSGLLWAASSLADIMVKTHHDVRAGKILLARQTYMMQQRDMADGLLIPGHATNRRHTGGVPSDPNGDDLAPSP